MNFQSISELVKMAEASNQTISAIVLEKSAEDMDVSKQSLYDTMEESLRVMQEAVELGMREDSRSVSGLTGGDAYKMQQQVLQGKNICGPLFGKAMAKALAVSEHNACMGKIVASPTAGSCGILPAALLTIMEEREVDWEKVVMSLFTASGIGMVVAKNACIAGASGGCQAECGSASAMAAGALVEIMGGTPEMVANACAIAFKNILGLVCDPVAGLVEIPCIKRNASGAANAFVAAELALAGIKSAIPVDEVIMAMKKIGDGMSMDLKETAEGGLAATPTGRALHEKVFGVQ